MKDFLREFFFSLTGHYATGGCLDLEGKSFYIVKYLKAIGWSGDAPYIKAENKIN